MAEAIIGDVEGPHQKFALICENCFAHNGLVMPEEYAFIKFRCMRCGYLNSKGTRGPSPSPSPTPSAHRLLAPGSYAVSTSSVVSSRSSDSSSDSERMSGGGVALPTAAAIPVSATHTPSLLSLRSSRDSMVAPREPPAAKATAASAAAAAISSSTAIHQASTAVASTPTNSGAAALEAFVLLAKSARGGACAQLILDALAAPGIFTFADLLAAQSIGELRNSPQHAPYLRLLEIFSYGTYIDYKS
ncbi:hypothetical protein HK405_011630 [Cladochytrium tenue]|nr:hypothetical protein HK405_011630 [Cladochytrium tenue]